MKQKAIRIPLGGKTLTLQFRAWYRKISTHYGVTNETFDGYFIPFWDFAEEFRFVDIVGSLQMQQERFDLSDIYIFQSAPSQSFRAVSFDKMIWTKTVGVIASTPCLDDQYLRFSLMRGRFVLRITDKEGKKEKLVRTLKHDGILMASRDHQAFFASKYPEIPKPVKYPGEVRVRLSQYESFR